MTTRRTALQTAGVPIPEGKLEEILGADDAVFEAAKKKAEERVSAMQQKGIALNSKPPLMRSIASASVCGNYVKCRMSRSTPVWTPTDIPMVSDLAVMPLKRF